MSLYLILLTAILPGVIATSADEYSHLSPTSIANLEEIAQQPANSTTIALFSIPIFVLWRVVYFSAQATECALARYTKNFRLLSFANQRTCVMYVLNIFYTTVAFGVHFAAYKVLYEDFTFINTRCVKIAGIVISVLYLFELTYRPAMRAQMLTHHFCTLFITFFLIACLQETQNPSIFVTALCWLFQATTEQGIFVGLLMYRFRGSPAVVPTVLRVGAAQALVVKFTFSVYVFTWWGMRQTHGHTSALEIAYSVIVVLSMSILMFTQFYGSWIVWKLAATYAKKHAAWSSTPDVEPKRASSSSAASTILNLGDGGSTGEREPKAEASAGTSMESLPYDVRFKMASVA